MYFLSFMIGAMVGGTIALAFHCMVIVGKESDAKWEEEQIMRNEEKLKKNDTKA